MTSFEYAGLDDPVRSDLAEAHRRAWAHVSAPGTWLTGAERVAVAEQTRRARDCEFCRERKAALSPYSVAGGHDGAGGGGLPPALVDAIHRVTTDAARLSEAFTHELLEARIAPEIYVEALGVAVLVISVDRFHDALGAPLEALPQPIPGKPTRVRPASVVEGQAWVPMQEARAFATSIGWKAGPIPNVLRALSLVPAEVLAWRDLSAVQYLHEDDMRRFGAARAIDRAQIELVAGRVSALNECFY